ncbi:cytochrome C oxidase subunit IV family protein [Pedosphaera parvula]|uniref:Caa(3)-type oxidase, subunit IV n=1 Tax=Pedosphaera parvula (strain Ellin514) TaxID=320771 RepID=B9XE48_PEDPL|nr:cytochrome C oxidase subunit IV family protein [Pedosphaera parvula]EEF61939.1 caa(3)-type oxidase, subunit IV [Pedosphaera parvula Ellin514]
MSSKIISVKTYLLVWISLILLLLITWGVSRINLGPFSIVIAMAIAVLKMLLVLLFFMHVRYGSRIIWIFAGAGFLWLMIMITLTLTDYITRGQVRPTNKSLSEFRKQMNSPDYLDKETHRDK